MSVRRQPHIQSSDGEGIILEKGIRFQEGVIIGYV